MYIDFSCILLCICCALTVHLSRSHCVFLKLSIIDLNITFANPDSIVKKILCRNLKYSSHQYLIKLYSHKLYLLDDNVILGGSVTLIFIIQCNKKAINIYRYCVGVMRLIAIISSCGYTFLGCISADPTSRL